MLLILYLMERALAGDATVVVVKFKDMLNVTYPSKDFKM